MNKICTSYEQSKSLLALGLDPNTADMKYDPRWDIPVIISEDDYDNHLNYDPEFENTDIPAWSLNTLWGLMPNDDYHITLIYKTNRGWCSEYQEEPKSEAEGMHYEYPESLYSVYADTPLDAAFEMMCWLLDSRKL